MTPPGPARPDAPAHFSDSMMYLGIALLFGSMGPMIGLLQAPAAGWANALILLAISGGLATVWAFMFQRRGWWFLLLIPLIVFPTFGIPLLMRAIGTMPFMAWGTGMSEIARRVVLLVMAMSCISLGFTLVIRYLMRVERSGARDRAELALATQIHASLVPPLDLSWRGVRVIGRSDPSGAMGGDLIDAIADHERLDLFLADVSGHGVRAGVVMGMLKAMLRTALRSGGDPSTHLSALNAVLADLTEPSMFATAVWVRLQPADPSTDPSPRALRATVVVAGHPPVFHFNARRGSWARLPGDSLPLGILPAEPFHATPIDLAPGDALILYTDGLTEAADTRGRQLGIDGLADLIARTPLTDPAAAPDQVLRAVRAVGTTQDDQTIVVLRVAETPDHQS